MENSFTIPSRKDCLQLLVSTPTWDILVIGGGASGLGIALDAAARGYKTLLVEQNDFAKGTSSRSTKLVHGGVRYLAQGNLRLVREASIERGLLHRNAPHLVRNQLFIIPVYSWWDRLQYTLGLKLYDKISGNLSLGPSSFLSRQKTMENLPGIRTAGLLGGVSYHDGQFDDSRMAISLVQTIWKQGGVAINYLKTVGLRKDSHGMINTVLLRDEETGNTYSVNAKAVINATGVFVDQIIQMDNATAEPKLCVSQGTHIVLDRSFYSSLHALMIPKTSDGRVLFAVPWHGKVLVGTTDTPVAAASLEPAAMEEEISFLLDNAGNYLEKKPVRADVLSVFAGLRPLAAPKKGRIKTKEISRSHKIIVSAAHLFTMLGGKWTTYRKMGEDMINRVEATLQWSHRPPRTASLQLHGYTDRVNRDDPFAVYGSDASLLRNQIKGNAFEWLSESLRIHEQQVVWAIEKEMARTLEDVLARRTRALFLDARESRRIAPAIAGMIANLLGKDEQWVKKELDRFHQLSAQYIPG